MRKSETFGSFMRITRESKNMTLEQLGNKLKKTPMVLSLIERSKNAPPNGKLLEDIIKHLTLKSDSAEANQLRDLSAIERGEIPNDVLNYVNTHPDVFDAIRRGMKQNKKSNDWKNVFKGAN